MALRIIAGKFKGQKLFQPSKKITRATKDRVKEAIFSMIQFKISKAIILDLFAGSGSLSFEAISRGAMKVLAVDNNKKVIEIINKNVQKLKVNNLDVFEYNAIDFLWTKQGCKFDFIFLTPPYIGLDLYNQALKLIAKFSLLNSNGYIILETLNLSKIIIPKDYVIQKIRHYGKIKIALLSVV